MAAGPGDAAADAYACAVDRTPQPRVLRGERQPRRARWYDDRFIEREFMITLVKKMINNILTYASTQRDDKGVTIVVDDEATYNDMEPHQDIEEAFEKPIQVT